MAIRGSKPKPNEIKKLTGSKHYNPDEPRMPKTANLRMPRGLSRDAQRFWRRYATILSESGVLTAGDLATFELCCKSYGVACEAYREIQEQGLTTVDKNGSVRKHPLLQVFRDATRQYTQLAALFGLDPANRSRLKVDPQVEDPFEQWVSKKLGEK